MESPLSLWSFAENRFYLFSFVCCNFKSEFDLAALVKIHSVYQMFIGSLIYIASATKNSIKYCGCRSPVPADWLELTRWLACIRDEIQCEHAQCVTVVGYFIKTILFFRHLFRLICYILIRIDGISLARVLNKAECRNQIIVHLLQIKWRCILLDLINFCSFVLWLNDLCDDLRQSQIMWIVFLWECGNREETTSVGF